MKIALIAPKLKTKTPSSSIQQQPTAIRNGKTETAQKRQQEEKKKKKSETHLTIIGVCTTIRPEKSGT